MRKGPPQKNRALGPIGCSSESIVPKQAKQYQTHDIPGNSYDDNPNPRYPYRPAQLPPPQLYYPAHQALEEDSNGTVKKEPHDDPP